MSKTARIIRIVTALAGLLFTVQLHAAQIIHRPDLVDYLTKLQRIYPAQAPSATLGIKPARTDKSKIGVPPGAGYNPSNVVYLSGVIEKGDAEKLDRILKDWTFFHTGIVLESPGGNFIEGLKLAKVIREAMSGNETNLGGVFVLKGTKCMSACALAFAGAVDPYHDVVDTRFVEDGAQLGFHMGILPKEVADRQVRAGDVLSLAYDIVAEYSQLIAANRNPPALLQNALKHRTATSFYIVNAGIEGWAMGFSPVTSGVLGSQIGPSVFDFGLVDQICNVLLTYGRTYKTSAEMEFGQFALSGNSPGGNLIDRFSLGGKIDIASTTEIFSCQFSVDENGRAGAIVWRGSSVCTSGTPDAGEHEWCATPAGATWRVTTGLLAEALGCPDGYFAAPGTKYFYGKKRMGKIKRDVNMRETASLKAAVVTQLKAGSSVEISDCRIVRDSQGVWFRVTSETGSGWTSARFVQEGRQFPHDPLEVR